MIPFLVSPIWSIQFISIISVYLIQFNQLRSDRSISVHFGDFLSWQYTTKNASFSCFFLSGVYKNASIDWLWVVFGKNAATPAAFTKHSPKISSIAAFFYMWWWGWFGFVMVCGVGWSRLCGSLWCGLVVWVWGFDLCGSGFWVGRLRRRFGMGLILGGFWWCSRGGGVGCCCDGVQWLRD